MRPARDRVRGLATSATLFADLSLVGVETGVGSLQLAGSKHAALFGEADGSDPLNFKADVALENH